jgi:hypothetical protein
MADIDQQEYDDLPGMSTYIANHINRDIDTNGIAHHICIICQGDLEPNRSRRSSQDEDDDGDYTVISVPPCNHLYHLHCLQNWFNTNLATRNRCPICRTPLCRYNADSTVHVTEAFTHWMGQDPSWHPKRYVALLTFVDEQVVSQPEGNDADYCAILRTMSDLWRSDGNQTICSDHARIGLYWVEYMVASRVRELIRAMDGMDNLWRVHQFFSMSYGMTERFDLAFAPP